MIAVGHWPGPLTLIGGARPEVPVELTAGTRTIGVRLPDDENVRSLVRACGGALTATSANVSGQPPARTAKEVENYFPEGIDLIIDGGEVTATEPSTVLDLSGPKARLIREGAISARSLGELLEGDRNWKNRTGERVAKARTISLRNDRSNLAKLTGRNACPTSQPSGSSQSPSRRSHQP